MKIAISALGILVIAVAACCVTLSGMQAMAGTDEAKDRTETQAPEADATVQIKGLTCPSCVFNVESTVAKLKGVKKIETDLNTGLARIWYEADGKPGLSDIWAAIKKSGFTPSKIIAGEQTYEGEKDPKSDS